MADLNDLVRIGIVDKVDRPKLMARVYYPDMSNMVSDMMKVIQHQRPYTTYDGAHKHTDSEGGETTSNGTHRHRVEPWMPEINDKVLVVMQAGFNSTGFIVGVIP